MATSQKLHFHFGRKAMTNIYHSKPFYTISPNYYRGGNYETGVRIGHKERKALYATLKEHFKQGGDTKFKTEQEGLDALKAAGLSLDDYSVCETCSVSFGW
jgi:hypothetical protein|tara:strand:+ start:1929 stop:2231 length:303 start_codon:yes stop_codon:yes gene_type:complete